MTDENKNTNLALLPAMTTIEAANRYQAVVDFTRTVMRSTHDYGEIPGTNKPTLLKPGAEKLCTLFGLSNRFEILDSIVNFDSGLFYFQYRCDLYRGDVFAGSGVGSCNSRESKYRYRYQEASYKPNKEEAEQLKAEKKGRWSKRNNGWVWLEKVENDEPFDILNTIDKMAQKRALIAATLIVTNASEFFTQDLEDLQYSVEAEVVEDAPPTGTQQPAPQKTEPPRRQPPATEPPERPYTAEVLKERIQKSAATFRNAISTGAQKGATDSSRQVLASALSKLVKDSAERYTMSQYLTGDASTKKMDAASVLALLRWLGNGKVEAVTFDYEPTSVEKQEARNAYDAAIAEKGQLNL